MFEYFPTNYTWNLGLNSVFSALAEFALRRKGEGPSFVRSTNHAKAEAGRKG